LIMMIARRELDAILRKFFGFFLKEIGRRGFVGGGSTSIGERNECQRGH